MEERVRRLLFAVREGKSAFLLLLVNFRTLLVLQLLFVSRFHIGSFSPSGGNSLQNFQIHERLSIGLFQVRFVSDRFLSREVTPLVLRFVSLHVSSFGG